jgi:hypothetical protein
MLRHKTILGLLDLSLLRGVKPAFSKFALKPMFAGQVNFGDHAGGREAESGVSDACAKHFKKQISQTPAA